MPRPPLPKAARRVTISARVAPASAREIMILARHAGGTGQAIDTIVLEARRANIMRQIIRKLAHGAPTLSSHPQITSDEMQAFDPNNHPH